jgi:glycolate oxidase iron-sulfur subunit
VSEPANTAGASAFDAHHPPSLEIIDTCVHCGFCLPVCPTYVLWGQEMDSPRGRIYLMKLASEGHAEMNANWIRHFDTCLGCMACMTACPSGVDYGKLIEATRAQIERKAQRGAGEKFHRRMIFEMFTRPRRLRWMRLPLLAYQKFGVQALVRGSGILKLLPENLRAMEALLPAIGATDAVAEVTPAAGTARRRVGLLLGCVQREFLPQINAATARVLAAEGCEVIAPMEQTCCGALPVHAGEENAAIELAKKTIEAFERVGVDTVVTNAAGCGSNVKEYGHLLRDDRNYADRGRIFASRCKDVCEVLADMPPRSTRHALKLRVAVHDACHLQHAQGVRLQPRALLAGIPELTLLEIPESPICCGSAGIYNLVEPQTAQELGDRKARFIAELNPDVVATGNPGCILQLQSSLARLGKKIPVVHTVQILDASLRGIPAAEFLRRPA